MSKSVIQQDKDERERLKPPQGGAGELKGGKETAGGELESKI